MSNPLLKRNMTQQHLFLLAVLILGLVLVLSRGLSLAVAHAEGGQVSLFGRVTDSQGEPVRGAKVSLVLNRTPLGDSAEDEHARVLAESQPDGAFVVDLPAGEVGAIETLVLEISRHHFKSLQWEAEDDEIARLNRGESLRLPDMELSRRLTAGFWVATLTFVAILVIIALEKLHNTMAALLGVAIVLGTTFVGGVVNPDLFIFDFERALEYVNFDVIFLVMGMMIVIGVIEETGIFQWLAYQSYRLSGGRAWLLVTILMLITSVASALLDNVTTMLLMTPMTIQIALALGIDPLSLLIPEVLASNVGGISTLIGTPTNILIGSYAGLSFNDFLIKLTPGVLLAQALFDQADAGRVVGPGRPDGLCPGSLPEAVPRAGRRAVRGIVEPAARERTHHPASQAAQVGPHFWRDVALFHPGRAHPPGAGGDRHPGRSGDVVVGDPRYRKHAQGGGLDDVDVLYLAVHRRWRHSRSRAHQHHR